MNFYTSCHLYGDNFLLRGVENGERFARRVPCKPYLFVRSKAVEPAYHSIKNEPLDRIDFDSPNDAREFIDNTRTLSNYRIYGMSQWQYPFLRDQYPGEIEYDPTAVVTAIIDIEVKSDEGFPQPEHARHPVTAITVAVNNIKHVFGIGEFVNPDPSNLVAYRKCADEKELLLAFLTKWDEIKPDVVTGWNVDWFDIPYLVNRIGNILGQKYVKRLSPWRIIRTREVTRNDKTSTLYVLYGISILDYMDLYRKYTYKQHESMALNFIAQQDLGEGKIDYSEHDSLNTLYDRDHQKFIEYNIRDVELVAKLENKHRFIEQVLAIAYDAKILYADTYTSTRLWDVMIHNYLLEQHICIPTFTKHAEKTQQIDGAYVKDPLVGMHKWVVSFDVNSLYPHLIMMLNISPETFVKKYEQTSIDNVLNGAIDILRDELDAHNLACSANLCLFDKDRQGFLPALMQKMYHDRSRYKQLMLQAKADYQQTKSVDAELRISRYHNMQQAKKIVLNSAYGALANQYYRWHDTRFAEAITLTGQLSIRWAERNLNAYLNSALKTQDVDYVIAIDTDSLYINLGPLVDRVMPGKTDAQIVEFIDRVCEQKIQKVIDDGFAKLGKYLNCYRQTLQMKRESIATRAIWTGKKHYALNVLDLEGVRYQQPELKLAGIEAVRSSTPKIVRDAIKKALGLIMNEGEHAIQQYLIDFRKEFGSMPFEDIASPRSANFGQYENAQTIYGKKCPVQVKGALIYNYWIQQKKLTNKYPLIRDGDKIKYAYLRKPNPLNQEVIACSAYLPRELGIEKYIDYDLQFDKTFLKPIEGILAAIGWKSQPQDTIESLFGAS